MKFDAIVGNPPYQILDGGAQASARPVYNLFVEFAKLLNPNFISFIIPSRWMTGGKGLDEFREKMINDKRFLILHDYINSKDCFPNVDIIGGVCYFLWNNKIKSQCDIYLYTVTGIVHSKRFLLENNCDGKFIRDQRLLQIKNKVNQISKKSIEHLISNRKPYGLRTDFFKDPSKYDLPPIFDKPIKDGYKILGLDEKQKRIIRFIPKDYPLPKKTNLNRYKIFISESYGCAPIGASFSTPVIPKPILAGPNELCTETFLEIGPFNNIEETKNIIKYIKTKFFRSLLGILKLTQHTTKKVYTYVPIQDFSKKSDIDWNKPISEIDYQLYKKYNFSPEDINFIESTISTIK